MSPHAQAVVAPTPSVAGHGRFRREGPIERSVYYAKLPFTFAKMWCHNLDGILHVLDIIRFRPMPAGLVRADHPWVTGLDPRDGEPIWWKNVIYRAPRARFDEADERAVPQTDDQVSDDVLDDVPDEVIVQRVGRFMANLVARSVPDPELPWGPQRRLPHGINYLHGAVHTSAGILIFNDFKDAIFHFTDPAFRREIRRFAREERREILLLFRTRDYDVAEFAFLVSFLRLAVPWFSNSNGPRKHVLWGNPAPFPVVNIITGFWKTDTYRLKTRPNSLDLVRETIPAGRYFQHERYRGSRERARWPEKLLAVYTYLRIRARGARGGLFFVDRRKLESLSGRDPYAGAPIASVFPLDADRGVSDRATGGHGGRAARGAARRAVPGAAHPAPPGVADSAPPWGLDA